MSDSYEIKVNGRLGDILTNATCAVGRCRLTDEESDFAKSVLGTEELNNVSVRPSSSGNDYLLVSYNRSACGSFPISCYHHKMGSVVGISSPKKPRY